MSNNTAKNATYAVAKINNVPIVYINDENQNVPLRPICDALGLDHSAQVQRVKRSKILSSVVVMITTTGSDGKEYEMICLPYKFIFGWLFSLDISRVSEEAQPIVEKYQQQCYDALYDHFVGARKFLEWKEKEVARLSEIERAARANFNQARTTLKQCQDESYTMINLSYEDYKENNRQLPIPFPEFTNEN
jgi:hypothetical protein